MSRFLIAKKKIHQSFEALSFASTPIETERAKRAMIFINWSGGPVAGTAYAEASYEAEGNLFFRLQSLPVATLSGTQGQVVIHLADISCARVRVFVDISSGSADFTIVAHASGEA
jgi:hypothetical protein